LPRQGKHLPIAEQMLEEPRVFTHDLPTNGIVYLDVGFDVR
jgi:presequence protease